MPFPFAILLLTFLLLLLLLRFFLACIFGVYTHIFPIIFCDDSTNSWCSQTIFHTIKPKIRVHAFVVCMLRARMCVSVFVRCFLFCIYNYLIIISEWVQWTSRFIYIYSILYIFICTPMYTFCVDKCSLYKSFYYNCCCRRCWHYFGLNLPIDVYGCARARSATLGRK